jgi:recombination protein RecR
MTEIDHLIQLLSRLPGLGPRSARRAVLHLIKRRESLMQPLAQALGDAAEAILVCGTCGNLDTFEPCGICMNEKREGSTVCVVEDVADLWALERTRSFKGRYHVLGGRLSALDGVGPEDLNIAGLVARAETGDIQEVILAMNLTVDGQTTAHYIADRLNHTEVDVTRLAHGVPVGGELDYLDDGTLETALRSRRSLG